MLTDEKKTNSAPFCEPSTKQCMNLQWTKCLNNVGEDVKGRKINLRNEKEVTGCNVREVMTS